MTIKPFLVLLLVFTALSAQAQEPFFSQFYNAPLTLNPALTGIAYGQVRLTSNYKSYMSSIDPFQTIGVSVDMSLFDNDKNLDFVGLGFSLVEDQSGFDFKHLKAHVSFSYHNAVGSNSFISFGLQGGLDNTSLGSTDLSSQSQWVPFTGYNPSLSNNERFEDDNALTVDFNTGLLFYSFVSDNTILFFGSSVYHLSEPKKSFFSGGAKLGRKYVVHAGAKINLNDKFIVSPNVVFLSQNAYHIINPGVSIEYKISEEAAVSLGGWIRNDDAAIAGLSLEYGELLLGLSYDLYLGESQGIQSSGGFELSATYHFNKKMTKKTTIMPNPSPRM